MFKNREELEAELRDVTRHRNLILEVRDAAAPVIAGWKELGSNAPMHGVRVGRAAHQLGVGAMNAGLIGVGVALAVGAAAAVGEWLNASDRDARIAALRAERGRIAKEKQGALATGLASAEDLRSRWERGLRQRSAEAVEVDVAQTPPEAVREGVGLMTDARKGLQDIVEAVEVGRYLQHEMAAWLRGEDSSGRIEPDPSGLALDAALTAASAVEGDPRILTYGQLSVLRSPYAQQVATLSPEFQLSLDTLFARTLRAWMPWGWLGGGDARAFWRAHVADVPWLNTRLQEAVFVRLGGFTGAMAVAVVLAWWVGR